MQALLRTANTQHKIVDDVACRVMDNGESRPIIPKALVKAFIQMCHGPLGAGHQQSMKTLATCRRFGWWKTMAQDVDQAVKRCVVCQIANKRAPKRTGLFRSPRADTPWTTLQMDFMHMPQRSSNGHRYVFTVADEFSRNIVAVPTETETAKELAKVLAEHVLLRFGWPNRVKSDQGKAFVDSVFVQFLDMFGVARTLAPPHTPEVVGRTERDHADIFRGLRAMLQSKLFKASNWDTALPAVVWSLNTAPISGTDITPHELLFGRTPPSVLEILQSPKPIGALDTSDLAEYVADLRESLVSTWERMHTIEEAAREARELRMNRGRKEPKVRIGDRVLLPNVAATKLQAKNCGPFRVVRRKARNSFELVSEKTGQHRTAHAREIIVMPREDDFDGENEMHLEYDARATLPTREPPGSLVSEDSMVIVEDPVFPQTYSRVARVLRCLDDDRQNLEGQLELQWYAATNPSAAMRLRNWTPVWWNPEKRKTKN